MLPWGARRFLALGAGTFAVGTVVLVDCDPFTTEDDPIHNASVPRRGEVLLPSLLAWSRAEVNRYGTAA